MTTLSKVLKPIFTLFFFFAVGYVFSQNIGIGTANPSPSSLLDITSSSRGLLIPRMTTAQRLAINSPATGLLVYQTDDPNRGFYYNSGTPGLQEWVLLVSSVYPMGTVTSVATGSGLTGGPITTSGTISAQNTAALWNANQLQSIPVAAVMPTSGQVLQFNGTNWIPQTISTGGITGSGTINYVPKFNSPTNLITSQIYDDGNNVGIGTATPTDKFHIVGRFRQEQPFNGVTYTMNITGGAAGLSINHTGSAGTLLQATSNTVTNSSNLVVFQTYGTGRGLELDNFNSSNPNSLMYLSNAGTGKYIDAAGNAYLSVGGTNWVNSSDVELKDNIALVDGKNLLEKISKLPITQWSYKSDDGKVKHIGPMAQDFYSLFGVGNDNKSISTIDPSGIALACIKELRIEIEELKSDILALRKEVRKLSQ